MWKWKQTQAISNKVQEFPKGTQVGQASLQAGAQPWEESGRSQAGVGRDDATEGLNQGQPVPGPAEPEPLGFGQPRWGCPTA